MKLLISFLSLFETCFLVDVCKPVIGYNVPAQKKSQVIIEPQEKPPK